MAVKQCCCDAKLSPNKKSIFGLKTQILSLLFVACFLAGPVAGDNGVSCSTVRNIFKSKGILSAVEIQDEPNSDVNGLCLNEGCCAPSSKARLLQQAQSQLETSLKTELTKLSESLANRAKKFDEFFRKLLQQSREDFHAMFKRTYGIIYEQHSYVFEQLFEQLERYYSKGDTELDNMIESFFGILYQKMFTVLNSQYSFDEKYLKCVGEHMKETQPFEDVPHKLSVQLRRAFVATRTFHKALKAGAEVVRNMIQVGVTPECVSSWARLKYCGACGGAQPPVCLRYCHNVLRGCLASHADLTQQWDAYVDAVEKVADRLLGPFNIVMVVEPIDIKISEAIMNFQEHNQEISQKIFSACGKPTLGGGGVAGPFFSPDRNRRSIRSLPELDWNPKSIENDFEFDTSFESILKQDPTLNSLNAPEEIGATVKKMAAKAKERATFLKFMRSDIDAEEFEEHERRRRDADPEPAAELDYKAYDFDGKRAGKKKKPASVSRPEGKDASQFGLGRLVRETRSLVRGSRRYWAQLPYVQCSEAGLTASPAKDVACFNGSAVGSYNLAAAGEGTAALASNPEVRGELPPAAPLVAPLAAQQEALRALTARLKDAYNGVEVQWKNTDDQQPEQSVIVESDGSGSGDDDITDDDEDRNNINDYVYGASGQGPTDDEDEVQTTAPNPEPPIQEVPFTPVVLSGGGDTRNVNVATSDSDDSAVDIAPRSGAIDTPVEHKPEVGSPSSAQSLQKALFNYALPVVCAWFGTIITDLI